MFFVNQSFYLTLLILKTICSLQEHNRQKSQHKEVPFHQEDYMVLEILRKWDICYQSKVSLSKASFFTHQIWIKATRNNLLYHLCHCQSVQSDLTPVFIFQDKWSMVKVSDSLSIPLRVSLSFTKGPNSVQDCSKAEKLLKVREQRPLVLFLHNCILFGLKPCICSV